MEKIAVKPVSGTKVRTKNVKPVGISMEKLTAMLEAEVAMKKAFNILSDVEKNIYAEKAANETTKLYHNMKNKEQKHFLKTASSENFRNHAIAGLKHHIWQSSRHTHGQGIGINKPVGVKHMEAAKNYERALKASPDHPLGKTPNHYMAKAGKASQEAHAWEHNV